MKVILKGSDSSGWYAPPKGTHTGEKHVSVGSGKSGNGVADVPAGYRVGADGNYYKHAPANLTVEVGEASDGWFMEPSDKGFSTKHLKTSGLSRSIAFSQGDAFLEKWKGILKYRVGYATKAGKQKYKTVYAGSVRAAEDKVRGWVKNYWRFAGDRTRSMIR